MAWRFLGGGEAVKVMETESTPLAPFFNSTQVRNQTRQSISMFFAVKLPQYPILLFIGLRLPPLSFQVFFRCCNQSPFARYKLMLVVARC